MTKQMLKGIRVNSKEELSERIYRYFDEINADPIVYHWTYMLYLLAVFSLTSSYESHISLKDL